jgi:hypothetical protein
MTTEKSIEIYELHWWSLFCLHIILLMIVFLSIWLWTFLYDIVEPSNVWRLSVLFIPGIVYLSWFPDFIVLFSVPKRIYFQENNIAVVDSLNHKKEYSYEIIECLTIKYNYRHFGKWTQFRATLHFPNTVVRFNPDHLPNFDIVLETIRSKGLTHVIEEK